MKLVPVTSGSNANPAMPRRPFRVVDAMILVAATALGYAAEGWLNATGGEVLWRGLRETYQEFVQQANNLSWASVVRSGPPHGG